MKTNLTDSELCQIMLEAETRKSDDSLPIEVRIRSSETYSICLREARNRGYDYSSLIAKAAT